MIVLAVLLSAMFLARAVEAAEPEKVAEASWILIASGRSAGRLAAPRAEAECVRIEVDRATWLRSAEKAGQKPAAGALREDVRLPEGAAGAREAGKTNRVVYRMAVPGERRKGKQPARQALRLRLLDSGEEIELCPRGVIHEYAWSPDGHWLACSQDGQLVVYDGATGKRAWALSCVDLSEDFFAHAVQQFCWRPDSGALAFRVLFLGGRLVVDGKPGVVAGDTDIFVVEIATRHRTHIELPPTFVLDPYSSLVPTRWQRADREGGD